MIRQFWDVYTAPAVNHLSSAEAFAEVKRVSATQGRKIISDRCAQTIASWWHSPASPYSTRLSTGGHVDRYATLDDFSDPTTWEAEHVPEADRQALRRLRDYLRYHQANAPSGARHCACHDCFSEIVGKAGDVCSECEEHGCDAQFSGSCDRPGAYGDPEEPPCEGCDDCIFCVPGV